jgi:hypothetical protein
VGWSGGEESRKAVYTRLSIAIRVRTNRFGIHRSSCKTSGNPLAHVVRAVFWQRHLGTVVRLLSWCHAVYREGLVVAVYDVTVSQCGGEGMLAELVRERG